MAETCSCCRARVSKPSDWVPSARVAGDERWSHAQRLSLHRDKVVVRGGELAGQGPRLCNSLFVTMAA